jgi:hypothetical protein
MSFGEYDREKEGPGSNSLGFGPSELLGLPQVTRL